MGIVDLAIESVLSGTKSLRVVRIFRLARVAYCVSIEDGQEPQPDAVYRSDSMLEILGQSAPFMFCVFFLLLFFSYLFTLAGMQLFGAFKHLMATKTVLTMVPSTTHSCPPSP